MGWDEKRILFTEDGLHGEPRKPHDGADDHWMGDASVVRESGDPFWLVISKLRAKVGTVNSNRSCSRRSKTDTTRNQCQADQTEFKVGEVDVDKLDDGKSFEVNNGSLETAVVDVLAVVIGADVVGVVDEGGQVDEASRPVEHVDHERKEGIKDVVRAKDLVESIDTLSNGKGHPSSGFSGDVIGIESLQKPPAGDLVVLRGEPSCKKSNRGEALRVDDVM